MDMAVKSAYSMLLAISALYFLRTPTHAQGSGLTLSRRDEAHLDSLAALTAKKIREAQLTEKEPSVLVIDFFRNSPGTTTQLGTILAPTSWLTTKHSFHFSCYYKLLVL